LASLNLTGEVVSFGLLDLLVDVELRIFLNAASRLADNVTVAPTLFLALLVAVSAAFLISSPANTNNIIAVVTSTNRIERPFFAVKLSHARLKKFTLNPPSDKVLV
jgi:hypothetical protein